MINFLKAGGVIKDLDKFLILDVLLWRIVALLFQMICLFFVVAFCVC